MNALLRDRRVQIGAAVLLVAVVVIALMATRSSSSDSSPAADAATSTLPADASVTTSSGGPTTMATTPPPAGGPTTSAASTPTTHDVHFPLADLPLTVTQTPTSGLHDGSKVSFHIVPTAGEQVFGVSVRLCAGDAKIEQLDDFEPATAGKCIGHALSSNSDLLIETAGNPPYQSLDVDFRVGVGTDTFKMTDGTPVSITCGPGHPCQIVLMLQVPNAFGFKTYPVTYG